MYTPYIELIRYLFPNAAIIIDRFHIIQALNRELNRCHVQWMNRVRHRDRRLYVSGGNEKETKQRLAT